MRKIEIPKAENTREIDKGRTLADIKENFPQLLEALTKGKTIYTVVTHSSRSGQHHRVKTLAYIEMNGEDHVVNFSRFASRLTGMPESKEETALNVEVGGCDQGYIVVYALGIALFNDGYAFNHQAL